MSQMTPPQPEARQPIPEGLSEQEAKEVAASVDVSSRIRDYVGPFSIFLTLVAAAMSGFHLYTTTFGFFDAPIQRAIFYSFVMVLGFAIYPFRYRPRQSTFRIPPVYDLVLMALGLWTGLYIVVNYETIVINMGLPSRSDIIAGSVATLLVLELARRAAGPILAGVSGFFLLYALFGGYIPGFLGHRGYPFERLVSHMYLTTEGIFGIAAGVATTYVFMFILFGAFLLRTGTGQLFIDLSVSLLGGFSGGPAKVSVVASGLMGSINGSSIANTVGTGAFTIPMMKSIGYKPHFAGAVEAAASTGGQLMPPIMGAGAFLMAEITGIPYVQIIMAAALPALLYYTGVLTGVHLEAKRTGLAGLPKDRLPSTWKVFKERGLLLTPIFAVIFMLLQGYTPPYAAITGIATAIVAGAIMPTTRVHPVQYWHALVQGARDAMGVSAAILAIGFIMGSATLTGAGLKIANGILMLSGGNIFLTLFFTMFASLLLGMGLPTTANYLVTSTIAAPALVTAGVPLLAAHLFVFYFGIIADLTPPVALAAMAGAGVAKSKPMLTAVTAFKLGAPAYLIPYVFALAPQITLVGYPFLDGLTASFTALLGIMALGISIMGYMFTRVPWWQRLPLFLSAFFMIVPGTQSDLLGIGVLGTVALLQWRTIRGERKKGMPETEEEEEKGRSAA